MHGTQWQNMESTESHETGFPPFPHSSEIPSGFPHSHGLDDWIYVLVPAQLEPERPQEACNGCLRSTAKCMSRYTHPLARLVFLIVRISAPELRAGVAGRNRPAEEGGGGRNAPADRE